MTNEKNANSSVFTKAKLIPVDDSLNVCRLKKPKCCEEWRLPVFKSNDEENYDISKEDIDIQILFRVFYTSVTKAYEKYSKYVNGQICVPREIEDLLIDEIDDLESMKIRNSFEIFSYHISKKYDALIKARNALKYGYI